MAQTENGLDAGARAGAGVVDGCARCAEVEALERIVEVLRGLVHSNHRDDTRRVGEGAVVAGVGCEIGHAQRVHHGLHQRARDAPAVCVVDDKGPAQQVARSRARVGVEAARGGSLGRAVKRDVILAHAAVGPRVGRGGLVIVPPDLGGAGAGEARVDVDAARVAGEFEWVGAGAARVEARQIVDEGLWVGRRGDVIGLTDSNGQGGATAREAGLHAIPVRIQGDLALTDEKGPP